MKNSKSTVLLNVIIILLRTASFFAGLALLAFGIFFIGVGQCHDSGGFCAGDPFYIAYVIGAASISVSGALLSWPFTTKIKKILTTAGIFLSLTVALIIQSEIAIH